MTLPARVTLYTTAIRAIIGKQGPQGIQGAPGADGATGPPANSGIVNIASGPTCEIDYATNGQVFKFTATENFSISVSNRPSGAWGVVLVLTNAGSYTVSYNASWMEAGGTALSFTAAGTDRVLITGEGSDEATVVITVTQADIQ